MNKRILYLLTNYFQKINNVYETSQNCENNCWYFANFDIHQIIFSFKFIGTMLTNIKIVYLLKGTLL